MLDVKRIRQNFDEVKKDVERRGKGDFGMEDVRKYDTERRELLAEVEQLKNRQNTASEAEEGRRRYHRPLQGTEGTQPAHQRTGR